MEGRYNFKGKVVIITGSSSGIGKGIAYLFSKLGANIVITARNEQNIKRVSHECQTISPNKLKPLEIIADLSIDRDVKRIVDSTIEHFGKIDVLVNNAGVLTFSYISGNNLMDDFESTMKLNLRSAVYLIHLTAPYLEKSKGTVINISSIGSIIPCKRFINYSMSKSALEMFTRCSALELGPKGIRVNCITCGAVESNIGSEIGSDKVRDQLSAKSKLTPLGIFGIPEDVANAVAYLASSESRLVTGISLPVDSGALLARIDNI